MTGGCGERRPGWSTVLHPQPAPGKEYGHVDREPEPEPGDRYGHPELERIATSRWESAGVLDTRLRQWSDRGRALQSECMGWKRRDDGLKIYRPKSPALDQTRPGSVVLLAGRADPGRKCAIGAAESPKWKFRTNAKRRRKGCASGGRRCGGWSEIYIGPARSACKRRPRIHQGRTGACPRHPTSGRGFGGWVRPQCVRDRARRPWRHDRASV